MMSVGTRPFAVNVSLMLAIKKMRAITRWTSAGQFHLCDTRKAAPQEHRDDQQAAPIAPTRFTYISTAAPFRHSCQIAKLLTSGDLIEDRDHHPEI
jgi:hypothetical protein